MRDAAIAIIREIGVETGGSNIQFAINPEKRRDGNHRNEPRVSRSSALASKATGFPIARLRPSWRWASPWTKSTTTSPVRPTPAFEPTIDYCVVKIPRWAFEKFSGAEDFLTTSMKSVGEVMAIRPHLQGGPAKRQSGRWRSPGSAWGPTGKDLPDLSPTELRSKLRVPNSQRLFYLRQAFQDGLTVNEVYELTGIDPWFLYQIRDLVGFSAELARFGELLRQGRGQDQLEDMLRRAKECGFSDRQLAHLWGGDEEHIAQMRRSMALIRSTSWWTPVPPNLKPTPPIFTPPMSGKTRPARP